MLRHMPIILVAAILLLLGLDPYLPLILKQGIYAMALSVKSCMMGVLPILIFMLLFKTIAQLSKKATGMLVFILIAICLSNFLSTMLSYQVGRGIYHTDVSLALPMISEGLLPLWRWELPKWIGNDQAMLAAIILGVICSWFIPGFAKRVSAVFDKTLPKMLKGLTMVVPVFVLGFMVKLIHDRVIVQLLKDYAWIFMAIAVAMLAYIACIYFIASRLSIKTWWQSLQNIFPAAFTGLTSMSSAAAMPLTLIGCEKNARNPYLARLTVPLTVSTHLIGDCFAIPVFAFAVMKQFAVVEPAFGAYLLFALYFVIAKFSVAAIPGGGILVMLPILESYLGFTSEMGSLITALYLLFDPVITCTNILGNGSFSMIVDRLYPKLTKKAYSDG